MNSNKEDVVAQAIAYFQEGYACSQAIAMSFAEEMDYDKRTAGAMASGFGSGMGRLRRTCGAVTGAFMALGLKFGDMPKADRDQKNKVYAYVRECNRRFVEIHGSSVCKDLLTKAAKSKDHSVAKHICDDCVRDAAGIAYDIMQEAE